MTTCAACMGTPSPLVPDARGSVGLPHSGVLTDSVALAKTGIGYVRVRATGNHYGTAELVRTIEHAASEVERLTPGPPLHVGDLSGKHGGRIAGHASHRSGRDVDLLFYAMTLGGARIPSQGWISYGPDGLGVAHDGEHGRTYVRIDVERNWLLARELLLSPYSQVMWLFVSNPLKSLMTEYALARGEDPLVVWQAENVMLQPKNSLPHDDHFHLRIMCPVGDSTYGCDDGGPIWPWLSPLPKLAWPESTEDIATLVEADSFSPL